MIFQLNTDQDADRDIVMLYHDVKTRRILNVLSKIKVSP